MVKRGSIVVTGLRARDRANKAKVVAQVRELVWPLLEAGTVRPIVHEKLPLERAGDAHRVLAQSQHVGKVLLTV